MSDNYKDTDLQEHKSSMAAFALAWTQPPPSSLTSHRNSRQLYHLLGTLLCRPRSLQAFKKNLINWSGFMF